MLNPDYSQVDLNPSISGSPTACIAFNTNIYYNSSTTQVSIVTNDKTYVATWSSGEGMDVTGCALTISTDGSVLFVANFITNATINNNVAYSLIPLSNNGIPTTDPPTVNSFQASIPVQTNAAFFNGNAFYQLVGGHNIWYAADFDNSVIWQIDSTANTATSFASASPHRSIAGVASDGVNIYTTASDPGPAILYASSGVLQPVLNTTSFNYAADITYVPAPTGLFYIPEAITGIIHYGTIDITSTPTWVPSSTSYLLGVSSFPFTIGFSTTGGTNTLRFYTMSEPSNSALFKLYLTNGGSAIGGDPHLRTIFGETYFLPHEATCFRLFDNNPPFLEDRIVINCSCWFLDAEAKRKWRERSGFVPSYMECQTYMRYVCLLFREERLIIDCETLDIVEFTNHSEVFTCQLPSLITKSKNGNVFELEPIFEYEKGLYNHNTKGFEKVGQTFARRIRITQSKDCKIQLTICSNTKSADRNNLDFHLQGTRELSSKIYRGALIQNSPSNRLSHLLST